MCVCMYACIALGSFGSKKDVTVLAPKCSLPLISNLPICTSFYSYISVESHSPCSLSWNITINCTIYYSYEIEMKDSYKVL